MGSDVVVRTKAVGAPRLALAAAMLALALAAAADLYLYEAQFGATGGIRSDNTGFKYPVGVAVAPDGSLLVSDQDNHRLVKLDANLQYAAQFGTTGTAKSDNTGLKQPAHLAVDTSGNVYVADLGNHRLVKLSPSLQYVAQFGVTGTAKADATGLQSPLGVALDAAGNVYVGDMNNHRVVKLDPSLQYVGQAGVTGQAKADSTGFKNPAGLAFDAAGNLLVADYGNHRLVKLDTNLQYVSQFGATGTAKTDSTGLNGPTGVAVGPYGSVYVADRENHRVVILAPDLTYLGQYGTTGAAKTDNTGLYRPYSVSLDAGGRMYVVDYFNHRLVRLVSTATCGDGVCGVGEACAQDCNGMAVRGAITSADYPDTSVTVNGAAFTWDAIYVSSGAGQLAIVDTRPGMYLQGDGPSISLNTVWKDGSQQYHMPTITSFAVTRTARSVAMTIVTDNEGKVSCTTWVTFFPDGTAYVRKLCQVGAGVSSKGWGFESGNVALDIFLTNGQTHKRWAPGGTLATYATGAYAGSYSIKVSDVMADGTTVLLDSGSARIGVYVANTTGFDVDGNPSDLGFTLASRDDPNHHFGIFRKGLTGPNQVLTVTPGTYESNVFLKRFASDVTDYDVQYWASLVDSFRNAVVAGQSCLVLDDSDLDIHWASLGTDGRPCAHRNALVPWAVKLGTQVFGSRMGAVLHVKKGTTSVNDWGWPDASQRVAWSVVEGASEVTAQGSLERGGVTQTVRYTFPRDEQRFKVEWSAQAPPPATDISRVLVRVLWDCRYATAVTAGRDGQTFTPGTSLDAWGAYGWYGIYDDGRLFGLLGMVRGASTAGTTLGIYSDPNDRTVDMDLAPGCIASGCSMTYHVYFGPKPADPWATLAAAAAEVAPPVLTYDGQFGVTGQARTDSNGLTQSNGVALSSDGGVLFADTDNHRVVKLTSGLQYAAQFGTTGQMKADNTGLGYPVGVAVDAQGNVYVGDNANHRLVKLTPDLQYAAQFGVTGQGRSDNTGLNQPRGVALDRSGNIYVVDAVNARVVKLSPGLQYVAQFGTTGVARSDATGLSGPWGVATDGAGNVYVADRNNRRVVKLDSGLNFVAQIAVTGAGSVDPVELAIDGCGTVFLTDSAGHRFLKLTSDFRYVGQFGETGVTTADNAHLDSPGGAAIDAQGRVYLSDGWHHRIIRIAQVSYVPCATPTPSPAATSSPTPTPGPSASPTPTPSASPTPTATPTPAASSGATPEPSASPAVTATPAPTPTPEPSASPTATTTSAPTAAPAATPAPSLKGNGASCSAASECSSGNCMSGVCCLAGYTCCSSEADCPLGMACGSRHFCEAAGATPGPTAAATPAPSAAPSAASTPAPAASGTPAPTSAAGGAATPSPTASPSAGRASNGKPCSSNDGCMSGNCMASVCCLAGERCCRSEADCAEGEVCNTVRAYCVPKEATPAPTEKPASQVTDDDAGAELASARRACDRAREKALDTAAIDSVVAEAQRALDSGDAARAYKLAIEARTTAERALSEVKKEVGEPCREGAECQTANCNHVCCLAGYVCCSKDAHCKLDESCDLERFVCSGGKAPAEEPKGIIDRLLRYREIAELGLLIAAVLGGLIVFLARRSFGPSSVVVVQQAPEEAYAPPEGWGAEAQQWQQPPSLEQPPQWQQPPAQPSPPSEGKSECPYCGATFVTKMVRCPHCGGSL